MLLFHLITGGKVPAFLGSSFAFLGGYATITAMDEPSNMLPYSCFVIACAGLVYLLLALLFKIFRAKKVMHFFPPIVTGPIIIAIGHALSCTAISSCSANWLVAPVDILVVFVCNIWSKRMIKIILILLGVIASYIVSMIVDLFFHLRRRLRLQSAGHLHHHHHAHRTGNHCVAHRRHLRHLLHRCQELCGRSRPARTLVGDGLATSVASLFGAPANTTYGETPVYRN